MFARKLILPFWPLMGILGLALFLLGFQAAIAHGIASDTVVYAGPCTPLRLTTVDADKREVAGLVVEYEGAKATTTDAAAIRAFHDGATELHVEINKHGSVVKVTRPGAQGDDQ